jgi:hypothetical protein
MTVEIRHADHVTPSIRNKLALTSPTSRSRSVGIVHSQTQAMDFFLVLVVVITILDNNHRPYLYLKHDISETRFFLHEMVRVYRGPPTCVEIHCVENVNPRSWFCVLAL